jgi:hypothetical protein
MKMAVIFLNLAQFLWQWEMRNWQWKSTKKVKVAVISREKVESGTEIGSLKYVFNLFYQNLSTSVVQYIPVVPHMDRQNTTSH